MTFDSQLSSFLWASNAHQRHPRKRVFKKLKKKDTSWQQQASSSKGSLWEIPVPETPVFTPTPPATASGGKRSEHRPATSVVQAQPSAFGGLALNLTNDDKQGHIPATFINFLQSRRPFTSATTCTSPFKHEPQPPKRLDTGDIVRVVKRRVRPAHKIAAPQTPVAKQQVHISTALPPEHHIITRYTVRPSGFKSGHPDHWTEPCDEAGSHVESSIDHVDVRGSVSGIQANGNNNNKCVYVIRSFPVSYDVTRSQPRELLELLKKLLSDLEGEKGNSKGENLKKDGTSYTEEDALRGTAAGLIALDAIEKLHNVEGKALSTVFTEAARQEALLCKDRAHVYNALREGYDQLAEEVSVQAKILRNALSTAAERESHLEAQAEGIKTLAGSLTRLAQSQRDQYKKDKQDLIEYTSKPQDGLDGYFQKALAKKMASKPAAHVHIQEGQAPSSEPFITDLDTNFDSSAAEGKPLELLHGSGSDDRHDTPLYSPIRTTNTYNGARDLNECHRSSSLTIDIHEHDYDEGSVPRLDSPERVILLGDMLEMRQRMVRLKAYADKRCEALSAQKIQLWWRGLHPPDWLPGDQFYAATLIQSCVRMWLMRNRFSYAVRTYRQNFASILIQKYARRFTAVKRKERLLKLINRAVNGALASVLKPLEVLEKKLAEGDSEALAALQLPNSAPASPRGRKQQATINLNKHKASVGSSNLLDHTANIHSAENIHTTTASIMSVSPKNDKSSLTGATIVAEVASTLSGLSNIGTGRVSSEIAMVVSKIQNITSQLQLQQSTRAATTNLCTNCQRQVARNSRTGELYTGSRRTIIQQTKEQSKEQTTNVNDGEDRGRETSGASSRGGGTQSSVKDHSASARFRPSISPSNEGPVSTSRKQREAAAESTKGGKDSGDSRSRMGSGASSKGESSRGRELSATR